MKRQNIILAIISLIIGIFVGISIKKNPVVKCDLYECVVEYATNSKYAATINKGIKCGFQITELKQEQIYITSKTLVDSLPRAIVIKQITDYIDEIYGNN